ncbi:MULTISPECIES: type II secretion system inner membrane protein GspF [Enterobacter]|uniref:type II secretion system inner membrane protein GspF n=1 Tax=Enterobacter TaxID=547 RepID=UPI0028ED9F3D|nr:type II secretion system inner membrane protein GspF [Enterobacter cloacae]WNT36153.1 type II secretion system inner membrane protein GspF [Enterobacter cloacae]HDR2795438.1 type II secretion system inner membrane protein GspF [Enterobacter asburiae]HDR2800819.1 type II secretion system inner membrane protein GspF [Enterobacter asburiae]
MKFRWVATDDNGDRHTGVSEAESEREMVARLRSQSLLPQSIKQQRHRTTLWRFSARVSHAELTLFTRQLATLMAAALPLDEALAAIQQQKESKNLVSIIGALRQAVLEGQSLSAAMQLHPRLFDTVYCTLVKAGETVGQAGAVLERLADFNEARQRMRSKLTQALIYPSLLTTVAILVVVILLTAVVPKVAAQFIHLRHELPLTTRLLLAISHFLSAQGSWLLLLFITLGGLFSCWLKREGNRLRFHRLLTRFRLVCAIDSARYLRALSILNVSGVPLLQAMALSAEGVMNQEIRQRLCSAAESVRQGNSVSQSLGKTHIFPPMMLYMIASGEKSGQLGELMQRATDNQEIHLQNRITMALAIFEPALIVLMAAIVLFIVVAVMQPILQLNSLMN